jgi:hypothetical protein
MGARLTGRLREMEDEINRIQIAEHRPVKEDGHNLWDRVTQALLQLQESGRQGSSAPERAGKTAQTHFGYAPAVRSSLRQPFQLARTECPPCPASLFQAYDTKRVYLVHDPVEARLVRPTRHIAKPVEAMAPIGFIA